jgi:hypothetical protein
MNADDIDTSAVDVGLGLVTFGIHGIQSASGLSPVIPEELSAVSRPAVTGTWGNPSPPIIVRATAKNTGRNVGFGTGDSVVLVFDQAVQRRSLATTGDVLELFEVCTHGPSGTECDNT